MDNEIIGHFVRIRRAFYELGYRLKWIKVSEEDKEIQVCLSLPSSGDVGYPIVSRALWDLDYHILMVDGTTRPKEIVVDCLLP